MSLLDGRTVLITGESGGIGAATAHRLAREGAQLVLSDIVKGQSLGYVDTVWV